MSNRILWADSLKGYLILLVILGHAIQFVIGDKCYDNHLWNLIYSFHMPAFFAISGYLTQLNKKSVGSYTVLIRRFNQLIVPYLCWSFISFLFSKDYSIFNASRIVLHPDAYYWFLWVLFWIFVLYQLCIYISKVASFSDLVPIITLSALLIILMIITDFRLFGFQFISYYFIYFVFGDIIRRCDGVMIKGSHFICGVLFLLFLFFAWNWKMHEAPKWFESFIPIPSSIMQYLYRGITALVAIILMFLIAPKLLCGKGRVNMFFSRLGVYSLGLYVVHLLLIPYIVACIKSVLPGSSTFLYVSLSFFVAFILSALIVYLLNMFKLTARLFLGKI